LPVDDDAEDAVADQPAEVEPLDDDVVADELVADELAADELVADELVEDELVEDEPDDFDDFDDFEEDFAADEDEIELAVEDEPADVIVEDEPDVVEDELVEDEPETEPEPEPEPEPALVTTGKHTPYHSRRGSGVLPVFAILAALACAAVVGKQALDGTLRDDISLNATLSGVAFVLLMYALRAIPRTRTVHLDDHGVLKVVIGDFASTFDLTSPSTNLEQIGTPGSRGWKIQVLRRSMSPVEIDDKSVDPRTFVEALRQWRPDL
jgi:hypothetical protein